MHRVPRTATVAITALTALAWILAVAAGQANAAAYVLGFIPARLSGMSVPFSAAPAILTPLSATIVHASLLHLAFNLLIFVWCGTAVERALGRASLLILYIVGAYAAALAQWLADPNGITPMVGASGAISAIIGAFALSFGRARQVTRSARVNRWINVAWLLVTWVVLQLMFGLLAGAQGFLLATPAHIGGFVAGLLLQRPLLLWRYRTA